MFPQAKRGLLAALASCPVERIMQNFGAVLYLCTFYLLDVMFRNSIWVAVKDCMILGEGRGDVGERGVLYDIILRDSVCVRRLWYILPLRENERGRGRGVCFLVLSWYYNICIRCHT